MNCKNCFIPVDGRSAIKCDTCESALHKECAISDGGTFCDVCYTVKEETPVKIEWELPPHIRRTYIETYRSCPHKFLKEVLEGNVQPPTIYTQLGIDLHEKFELAIQNVDYTQQDMHEQIKEIFDSYSDSLFGDVDKENMRQRAIDSIDTFYTVLPTLDKVFTTEETIHFSIGDDLPLVEFTMDLVTENERGNLDMHDWKTGNVMVGKKLSSDLQAPLYVYGVQKHFNREVDTFTFYYLKENKTRVFERVDHDNFKCMVGKREYHINLQDAIREVKTIFSHIKKGNFNIPSDTRSMYYACKMCHLKKQGLCRGADEEIWYQQ